MRTESALLAAVCDAPEDDLPRLAYADWLEEQGDPDSADFIRVQCRLAPLADDDPARLGLERREEELLVLAKRLLARLQNIENETSLDWLAVEAAAKAA